MCDSSARVPASREDRRQEVSTGRGRDWPANHEWYPKLNELSKTSRSLGAAALRRGAVRGPVQDRGNETGRYGAKAMSSASWATTSCVSVNGICVRRWPVVEP